MVVLLVEDDELIRVATEEMLRDIGCQVKDAATAEAALQVLDEGPVDLLLTDVGLPGVSGLQLANAARARRLDLCLVLATGDSAARAEAARLSATVVLKPYDPQALRQALQHSLALRGT